MKIYVLKNRRFKGLRFTDADRLWFLEHYQKGAKWLASHFYTSTERIREKAKEYGVKFGDEPKVYSKKDDSFIRKNIGLGIKYLAYKMKVSPGAMERKLFRMGLKDALKKRIG